MTRLLSLRIDASGIAEDSNGAFDDEARSSVLLFIQDLFVTESVTNV